MARTPVATDTFNRAGPALGANWATLNNSGAGDIVISASTVFTGSNANTVPTVAVARWVGAGSFAANQYSSAVFVETDFGDANYGIGVVCRASADIDGARDYYYFHALSNDVAVFGKVVNGTHTQFHSAAQVWNDGDRVELECEGTTIRAMRNGVALGGSFTQTDSAIASGNPGIAANGDSAVATGDSWEGGSLVSAYALVADSGTYGVTGTAATLTYVPTPTPGRGLAEVDFGVFPGMTEASVAVTGQADILTTSRVEAWIDLMHATAEHSEDEHRIEPLEFRAGAIVAGVGFTVFAELITPDATRVATRVYGKYSVQWAWN